jgi:hypothetical protein
MRTQTLAPPQDPWRHTDPRGLTVFTYMPSTVLHPDFIPTMPVSRATINAIIAAGAPTHIRRRRTFRFRAGAR